MVERKTWAWLAAGAAVIGAGAFAQGGVTGGERGEARPMVQLPPAAATAANGTAPASAGVSSASLTTTVGGALLQKS